MIRPARPEDAAAIRAIAEAAYAPFIPLIGRRPAPMDADFPAQIAAGRVWAAEGEAQGQGAEGRAGAILGYVALEFRADDALLESVAVHPRAAGRGLGRALIAFAEAEARRRGRSVLRLYTNARMTANLKLYPRLGYRETARRREDGFDRAFFEKPLV